MGYLQWYIFGLRFVLFGLEVTVENFTKFDFCLTAESKGQHVCRIKMKNEANGSKNQMNTQKNRILSTRHTLEMRKDNW